MIKGNNSKIANEIYTKTLEDKLGKFVEISLSVPTNILEEFTDYAVSVGHMDINSALIETMKDVSQPKKRGRKTIQPQ